MVERGGYGRNARVLTKHDLFYRSLRAAGIIPGRSAGSYLPSPAWRAGPDTEGGGEVRTGETGGLSDRGINRYRTLLEPPGRRQVRNNVLLTVVEKLQRYAVQIRFFLVFYLFKENVDSYSVEN